jgi:hypothetical protein
MPIVAMCPYCRAGGVRAPESAVGQSATCPSCKSNFTVVPSDDPAAKAAAAVPPPPAPLWKTEHAPDKPRPAVEETREHSSPVDVTEPSPVLPAERPDPAARPVVPPDPLPAEAVGPGFAFALGAVTLFGVGMLAAQFVPFGRAIGVGVCGLGFVGGVLCLGAEGRARLVAAAAAVLNLAAVLLLLFAPEFLGLAPWFGGEPDDEPGLTGPVAVALKTGVVMPAGEWVKADQAAWQAGEVRIAVRSAAVGPAELVGPAGAKRRTREPYLVLTLAVANVGVERRVELSGWMTGAADQIALTDPSGRRLKPRAFDPGWGLADPPPAAGAGLGPGTAVTVRFAFDPPGKAEYLRLELPGGAVGREEAARFRLPGPFGVPAGKR